MPLFIHAVNSSSPHANFYSKHSSVCIIFIVSASMPCNPNLPTPYVFEKHLLDEIFLYFFLPINLYSLTITNNKQFQSLK